MACPAVGLERVPVVQEVCPWAVGARIGLVETMLAHPRSLATRAGWLFVISMLQTSALWVCSLV